MSARLVALNSAGERVIIDEFADSVISETKGEWLLISDSSTSKALGLYSAHAIMGLEFIDE